MTNECGGSQGSLRPSASPAVRETMTDAPRNGEKILAYHSLHGWMSIKWAQLLRDRDDAPWVTVAMDHAWPECAFTHWTDLPPTPNTEVGQDG